MRSSIWTRGQTREARGDAGPDGLGESTRSAPSRRAAVWLVPMELPRVNAIGLLEVPGDFPRPPRRYPRWQRRMVLALLAVFALVTLVTTGASLGSYCLTTDGGDVRALPWNTQKPPIGEPAHP